MGDKAPVDFDAIDEAAESFRPSWAAEEPSAAAAAPPIVPAPAVIVGTPVISVGAAAPSSPSVNGNGKTTTSPGVAPAVPMRAASIRSAR